MFQRLATERAWDLGTLIAVGWANRIRTKGLELDQEKKKGTNNLYIT